MGLLDDPLIISATVLSHRLQGDVRAVSTYHICGVPGGGKSSKSGIVGNLWGARESRRLSSWHFLWRRTWHTYIQKAYDASPSISFTYIHKLSKPTTDTKDNHRKRLPIMVSIKQLTLLALATGLATVDAQSTGKTTRYWDCCKGSCAWSGKAPVSSPIKTCDKNDNPLSDVNTKSGCDGGSAYMCTDQSPWAVSDDLAYGFAAVKLSGKTESNWCCACYE